jgi:cellobiose transport system permease protein
MGVLVPYITSVAAVALIFNQIFARDYGLLNWFLQPFVDNPIDWRADKWASWLAVSAMVTWHWTGYNALIYLAAMQAIPKDLYEAAAIDGASRIRQFWQITVPMLRPTILFTVIISTIGGLQLFTEPVLFSVGTPNKMDGGAMHQFQTITMYMYDNAFGHDRYGYGATVAWALFVMIIIFSLINFLAVRRTGGSK